MKTLSQIISPNGIFNDGDWIESKDQDPNGEVRIIQLADIGDGYFVNKSNRFMNLAQAERLKCTFLQPGDVLMARMPDPIGRACIFPNINTKAVTAVDVCVIRPNNPKIDNLFLKYIINNDLFRREINKHITGTTRKRISRKNLNKIKFNLPIIDNQKRIAKVLSDCETLIEKRKESITLLDELLKSTFLEMFGDPVKNEKGWKIVPLSKFGTIERGISKHRPRNSPKLLNGVHPLIQTGDIANSSTYIEKYTKTYSDLGLAQSKKWPAGTLCISIAANIAKTGILKFDACFPDSVVGFIVDKNSATNFFVHHLFAFFQKILEKNAPAAAQKNINLAILRSFKVPHPPIELQQKFDEIALIIEDLKSKYKYHLKELEDLYGSLSQLAFKGQLDVSRVLLRKTKYFSADSNETPEDFKKEMDKSIGQITTPVAGSLEPTKVVNKIPVFLEKEILKLKVIPKVKRDITNLSLADFYGIPVDIQASRENIDFDFMGDDVFYQFLLKDHFKNKSFTSQDLFEKLHNFFYHKGDMDFDNEKWKNIIFQFIDAKPPLLEQIYDDEDNTVKLKLTDEAYKA
ncbi:restriction endonuclease subunit S [Flavobacterium gelidilacus]|nr:restriction endonuclease subunit S [Flavobacterium gelidilacus]